MITDLRLMQLSKVLSGISIDSSLLQSKNAYFVIIRKVSGNVIRFKATPHKDCAAETQSDFSSDCTEIL